MHNSKGLLLSSGECEVHHATRPATSTKQGFAASARIAHGLEEAKVKRQPVLRDASGGRSQEPSSDQNPYVDGPLLARVWVQILDRVGCVHVPGLCVRR